MLGAGELAARMGPGSWCPTRPSVLVPDEPFFCSVSLSESVTQLPLCCLSLRLAVSLSPFSTPVSVSQFLPASLLSLFLSLPPILRLSVSFHLCVYLSISYRPYLSASVIICLCLPLSLRQLISLSLSLCFSYSDFLCLSLPL